MTVFIVSFGVIFFAFANQSSNQNIQKEWFRIDGKDVVCENECVTRILYANKPFSFADIEWDIQDVFKIRFLEKNTWTEWMDVKGELDTPDESDHKPSQIFSLHQGKAFQLSSSQRGDFSSLTIILFSLPPDENNTNQQFYIASDQSQASSNTLPLLPLITRSEWLSGNIELTESEREQKWPSKYDGIQKFIIHHTATNNRDVNGDGTIDTQDYRDLVRAIYVSHASNRGWGDIGYQYIIDPLGTIWEGRYGGDGSIGGHAYRDKRCTKFGVGDVGFNRGTIGVSLLGTFSSQDITPEARESLTKLIARKSWEFGIAPNGMSEYAGVMYANVIGHRDVDCTDCPGDKIVNSLSSISFDAQKRYEDFKNTIPRTVKAEFFDMSTSQLELQNGATKYVTVRFKNTGTVAWRGYGDHALYIAAADVKAYLASLESFTIAAESKAENTNQIEQQTSQLMRDSSIYLAKLKQPNIYPGEVGEFYVPISQITPELKSEKKLVMVLGNQGWLPQTDLAIALTNTSLEYAGILESNGQNYAILDNPGEIITLQFRNKGTLVWERGEVGFHIASLDNEQSQLADASWKKNKEQFFFQEETVKPGELATFSLHVHGKELGEVRQYIALYRGEEKISGSDYETFSANVQPAYALRIAEHTIPEILKNPSSKKVSVTLENIGHNDLDNMVLMGYGDASTKQSALKGKNWISATRIGKIPTIKAGQARRVEFYLASPVKSGTYPLTLAFTRAKKNVFIEQDGLHELEQKFEVQVLQKPKPVVKKKTVLIKKKK